MTATEPATTVSIASGPLVGPILRRVVGMLSKLCLKLVEQEAATAKA